MGGTYRGEGPAEGPISAGEIVGPGPFWSKKNAAGWTPFKPYPGAFLNDPGVGNFTGGEANKKKTPTAVRTPCTPPPGPGFLLSKRKALEGPDRIGRPC